jgi:hypothetical protein
MVVAIGASPSPIGIDDRIVIHWFINRIIIIIMIIRVIGMNRFNNTSA